MTAEPQPLRLYKFGPWPKRESPARQDATPLGARVMQWLQDGSGDLDADLSRILFREFNAQETYRQAVVRQLGLARQQLEAAQAQLKGEERQPNGTGDAFAYGFSMGQRAALLDAAQLVQDAINGAFDSVTGGACE